MSDLACALPAKEQFLEQVGSAFRISLPDGRSADLVLVRLEDHVSTATHQNFSLIFRGPVDMPREQGLYSLENATIGMVDLFLVPIKLDAEGLELEAVFNLVAPSGRAESASREA